MKKEERYNTFWKYVLLIAGSILILIPLLATVFSSFKTTKDIMQHFFAFPNPVTLSNYTRLLADGIGHYFLNSTIITVVSVILVTLFIPAAAYSIARNMSKKRAFNIMYSLLILGIFVPFQVIMIPITVMMSRLGLTNIWGLIILYLTYAVPQTLFLYVGYIKLSVPDSLDEAAEIDGAGHILIFRKIVIPLGKPILVTIGLFSGLAYWNDWTNGLYYISDAKLLSIQTLLNKMIQNIQAIQANTAASANASAMSIPQVSIRMAIAFIAMLPILVIFPFIQKYLESGIALGAVKG